MMLLHAQLLTMVARKLGHDWLLLRSGAWTCEEKWACNAVFGHYCNYDTVLLMADGKAVSVKSADAEGHLRSNDDMYAELVGLLYKTLDSGGDVSDGERALRAEEVPEFMIECVLSGYA